MRNTGKIKYLLAFALFALISCGKVAAPEIRDENLTVSAAISLKDAFSEIGILFESETGKKIDFNFGASGALQQQIENGAPVDVFASAGEKQVIELEDRGFVEKNSERAFAGNSLVLIVPAKSNSGISSFADLPASSVKKIAIGNPKTVPAGQYAQEFLQNSAISESVQGKLIFAENVRQVLEYVSRGEVDAGIVYLTDALEEKSNVRIAAEADSALHSPILYPIAVITNVKQMQAAKAFTEFVRGAKAQEILRKYGFKSAGEK